MPLKDLSNKMVVVITINYNHSKDTINCVDSVLRSTHENFKVIIVDNGSEEEDYRILGNSFEGKKNVMVLRMKENKGYVGGVNFGLKEGAKFNPDYFLIMNNDTIIDKEAISALVETAEKHKGNAIVTGKVYNMDEPDTLQYVGQYTVDERKLIFNPYVKGEREKDIGKYEEEMELGMADDIFWLLPKKIFNKVGYYSTYFFLYGEQNDYALKVKKEGYKLIYTPKAKLWHIEHLTTGKAVRDNHKVKYWQTYSSFILYYLHMNKLIFAQTIIKKFIYINLRYFIHISRIKKSLFIEASYKALWNFIFWMFNKKENTGYNPYS